jgi:hypothetical protein
MVVKMEKKITKIFDLELTSSSNIMSKAEEK